MALKKSELYSSLGQSCDELRGGMDASQYKDYVIVPLFIKYISDKYADQPYAPITIPPGAGFKDMVALKGRSDIGDQINKKIIAPLAKANQQLSQADFPDFNDPVKLGDGKERQDRLTNLIAIFENPALDFSKNRTEGDDILGDAYEYLMRHFATQSGKSKGQFYTPAEVSRVMAQVIGIRHAKTSPGTTVNDPTCGSGSLLLKVADEARTPITLYGQEKDAATAGLARMNMILHNNPTALIVQGNTLADPKFKDGDTLKTFDYVVANIPFSDKRWSTGIDPLHDPYERFQPFSTPPAKQGDYAYLLHIVRSLKSTGKGACILPHGVLFRGNAEAAIRRALVRKGYIKGIIGLPANLFYGTGIPACIVVIDKEDAQARKGIFMIDASAGFMKDGPKNRLRAQDIHKIVDVFNRRLDVPKYSRMVNVEEIERNEFNLNLPRYIDSQTPEDVQDIAGHLQGGIPAADVEALHRYWAVCPNLKATLFRPTGNTGFQPAKSGQDGRAPAGNAGFQPAHPLNDPKGWHSRGYLPHFDGGNVLQFLTFRLADSVPHDRIERWKHELNWHAGLDPNSPESIALRKSIEHYEDAGHGACHLRDQRIAYLVQEALLHFDGQRYRMIAWCIMPNHVHALLETTDSSFSSILHTWKSFTAKEANKMLGCSGPFWMSDYFDRYIRNDEHLQSTLDYIRENPVKAGLVQRAEEWQWSSASADVEMRVPSPKECGLKECGLKECGLKECGQDGRAPANAPGYVDLAVEKSAIKSAIYEHPEFTTFIAGMNAHFAAWREMCAATLKALQAGCHPKEVIAQLSEGLLAHYAGKPLIDPYDIYQHLMDYWAETMQDDCYLIAADGWKAETARIIEKDKKGREKDKGWTCDVIPKARIVARYFAREQAAIDQLATELEGVTARLTEMEEDPGNAGFQPAKSGQDGRAPAGNAGFQPASSAEDSNPFADLDKVNKANVTARLKEIKAEMGTKAGTRASSPPEYEESGQDGRAPASDEAAVLTDWLKLNDEEADLKKRLKEAEAALDAQAYARYPKLTESEIKTLVVDDKWLAALGAAIHCEMDRVSQQLTQRVKELAERYETPLPQMVSRVTELEAKVNRHLATMGFSWK